MVDNLAEGINKIKCKYGHDNRECETCGIKYKYCERCVEYTNVKVDIIEHKCICCNKNYQKFFEWNLKNDLSIHTSFLTVT